MRQLINLIMLFIIIGAVFCFFVLGMILFFYLFIFVLGIALILMLRNWIRKKFYTTQTPSKPTEQHKGRIIDSDEWNQL